MDEQARDAGSDVVGPAVGSRALWALVALVAFAAACGGGDQAAETGQEAESGPAPRQATQPALPDTTGAAVWAYLQQVGYRDAWETWPGKGQLYKGQEPHGMLLTTYLNGQAYDELTGDAESFSPGAIIVKENYKPDSTLAAVTTMYKVEGYNPEAGDWFWVKHLPDGSVDAGGKAQGRVKGCIGCHGGKRDNDFIFTADLDSVGDGGGPGSGE